MPADYTLHPVDPLAAEITGTRAFMGIRDQDWVRFFREQRIGHQVDSVLCITASSGRAPARAYRHLECPLIRSDVGTGIRPACSRPAGILLDLRARLPPRGDFPLCSEMTWTRRRVC